MTYWIFKVSDRGSYPDAPGREYVYDNTHSVHVESNDEFLYLEKAASKYRLTGAGCVSRVTCRGAKPSEKHSERVDRVFTAHLTDMAWFSKPFDLSSQTIAGRRNRQSVGLPGDVNRIGWSISMPRIDHDLFVRLLDAALDAGPVKAAGSIEGNWRVDDSWSLVRKRGCMKKFRAEVFARHKFSCLVCGTRLRSVLDAAHLRSYASDPEQRANPSNGICLCRFCHAAFDAGDILLHPNGRVEVRAAIEDPIAKCHFGSVPESQRGLLLAGVDLRFLMERLEMAAPK